MATRFFRRGMLSRLQSVHCGAWYCRRRMDRNAMSTLVENDNQLSHFVNISREDTEFLRDTKIQRIRKVRARDGDKTTLWKYLSTYLKSYDEKLVLNDHKEAGKIALAVERTSERGENTVFFDSDGGFHRVVEELTIKKQVFNHCKLFVRDINLKLTTDRAQTSYLKNCNSCEAAIVNLGSMPADDIKFSGELISDLYKEIAKHPARQWEDKEPNYTLLGCVSHGMVKYFINRCLHRKTYWFSEFHLGRPEFYFVIKPTTWVSLSLMAPVYQYPLNVMFNVFFDYEMIEVLDRKSFAPWKPVNRVAPHTVKLLKQLDLVEGRDLVLMRARPKVDNGMARKDLPEYFFSYFIHAMFRQRSEQQILNLMNQWSPEAAYECARQGFSVRFVTKDVQASQLVDLFNILTLQPGFERSNFQILAKIFQENKIADDQEDSDESKAKLLELKRKYFKKSKEAKEK